MLTLFSIYYNLALSYAFGIVPLAYNFRTGHFESRKPVATAASVLLLVWVGLNFQHRKLTSHMTMKVVMQSVIHAAEYIVLNGTWLLIGVQQLLYLENYRQLLGELLANARSWDRRRCLGMGASLALLFKLVLLPTGMVLLHVTVYQLLVEFQTSIGHALLTMVTFIPNMAHVNNFYALLFAQRLTLREINDKLAKLWAVSVRCSGYGEGSSIAAELPVADRLRQLLQEYHQCAGTLRQILQLYSLPVALYLLLLLQEIMSKLFYQFTFFYSLSIENLRSVKLEILGATMLIVYGIETTLLIGTCSGISDESHKIKSAVHRLSLIPDQGPHFQEMVKSFLLSLNHYPLEVKVGGMFTMDFEMLVGMFAAISNFVVLLAQFHIDYTRSVLKFNPKNSSNDSPPL